MLAIVVGRDEVMDSAAAIDVSVVIPALNEAREIGRTLGGLIGGHGLEAIVVDGGSEDATVEIATRFAGVRCLAAPRGRAQQMNAGASAARGRILLFLHADSRLPAHAVEALAGALERSGHSGGAFRFALDSPRRRYRVLEWCVAQRARRLDLPYGDQAIFVTRDAFERIGGFRELPACEDVDFVCRLRALGPLLHLETPAVTSARRWERGGFVRTTLRNWGWLALYALGAVRSSSSARTGAAKDPAR
jgi:rSAM/selenodomain-associated transferase 2